jgi:iron complex outermembrane recepter protein
MHFLAAVDESWDDKCLLRCRLSVSVLLGLSILACAAQAQTDDRPAPDEVETPSQRRQSIFFSPAAVSVISREEIRTSGANSIHDLLRRVPGMDIFDMKTYFPLVGARALAGHFSNRVLLLIDGREHLWELTGAAIWGAMSIDLEEIERIEIIRGPGSTLYGANAYSAVINIITIVQNPDSEREVLISGSEQGHLRLVGQFQDSLTIGNGKIFGGLLIAYEGKRSSSDFREQPQAPRAHGSFHYRSDSGLHLSLQAGATGGEGLFYMDMGDLGFANAYNYWIFAKAETALAERFRLTSQIYFMTAHLDFRYRSKLQSMNTWLADMPDMTWNTYTLDGQAKIDLELFNDFFLIGGLQLRYTLLDNFFIIVNDASELRGAAWAHIQWTVLANLQLTGGLRLDLNADSEYALSPKISAVYRPWPQHALRLSYASAFRKPSDYESRVHVDIQNYNPATPEVVDLLASQLGNEALGNEEVHAFEAGWRSHLFGNRLQLSLELFFNLYSDLIFFEVDIPSRLGAPDVINSTLQYQHDASRIYAMGGEIELSWRPTKIFSTWCNLGLRRVYNSTTNQQLPGEPQVRLNAGGRFTPQSGLFIDIALHYVSDYQVPLRDPIDPLDDPKYFQLGNNLLMFGRLGYRFSVGPTQKLDGGLTIRLPLGESFREFAGLTAPDSLRNWDIADFGGEILNRLISIYFRGSF